MFASYRDSPEKQRCRLHAAQQQRECGCAFRSCSESLPHSRSNSPAAYAFFGRGLQAKMEGQNEGKYLKTGEVEIFWRTRRESNPQPPA